MRPSSAEPPEPTLSIGAVVAVLRPDYPDVSVSKVRFLESAGLIVPERNDSGMRVFAAHDVERLAQCWGTKRRETQRPVRRDVELGTQAGCPGRVAAEAIIVAEQNGQL